MFVSVLLVKENNNFLLWAPIWAMGSGAGCFCLFGAWIPRGKKTERATILNLLYSVYWFGNVCGNVLATAHMWKSTGNWRVGLLRQLSRSRRSNSGGQPWCQVPLPTEPTLWPKSPLKLCLWNIGSVFGDWSLLPGSCTHQANALQLNHIPSPAPSVR